jgi:hypothetical protein
MAENPSVSAFEAIAFQIRDRQLLVNNSIASAENRIVS